MSADNVTTLVRRWIGLLSSTKTLLREKSHRKGSLQLSLRTTHSDLTHLRLSREMSNYWWWKWDSLLADKLLHITPPLTKMTLIKTTFSKPNRNHTSTITEIHCNLSSTTLPNHYTMPVLKVTNNQSLLMECLTPKLDNPTSGLEFAAHPSMLPSFRKKMYRINYTDKHRRPEKGSKS